MAQKGLLDELADRAGFIYLSELHENKNRKIIKDILMDMAEKNYSLTEWNNAMSYIFHMEETFTAVEEALEYITEHT